MTKTATPLGTSISTASTTTLTSVPSSHTTFKQTTPKPIKRELWDHCIDTILVLNKDGKAELRGGDMYGIINMFQIMTQLKKFYSRYADPKSPTIVYVRYLLMHLFLHDHQIDRTDLMSHNEDFCVL